MPGGPKCNAVTAMNMARSSTGKCKSKCYQATQLTKTIKEALSCSQGSQLLFISQLVPSRHRGCNCLPGDRGPECWDSDQLQPPTLHSNYTHSADISQVCCISGSGVGMEVQRQCLPERIPEIKGTTDRYTI